MQSVTALYRAVLVQSTEYPPAWGKGKSKDSKMQISKSHGVQYQMIYFSCREQGRFANKNAQGPCRYCR